MRAESQSRSQRRCSAQRAQCDEQSLHQKSTRSGPRTSGRSQHVIQTHTAPENTSPSANLQLIRATNMRQKQMLSHSVMHFVHEMCSCHGKKVVVCRGKTEKRRRTNRETHSYSMQMSARHSQQETGTFWKTIIKTVGMQNK